MSQDRNELKNPLLEIGFSNKEAEVYIAILTLGRGTASKIARSAHIARTTVYDILSSLFDKGLVTLSGKEPKQEYVALSPDELNTYIEKEFEKKKNDLKKVQDSLVPQLKSIHNIKNRPKIMFYEGKEGLKKVYEDTLSSHGEIRACATYDNMQETLPGYFPEYFYRRAEKGIKIRAIFPYTEDGVELSKHDKEQLRETAMVPHDKFLFSPEINIYDNKIMIASWKEELGITIESDEIADAMKKIFELAWAEAKRCDAELKKANQQNVL
ncbi:MAG: helix-turn-helix domain-containing protein [Patescibacteria group bacterium]